MLKKHQCIPFLDKNKGSGTESWVRIDKSQIFSLNPNPQTETYDYICDEFPTEEVDKYQPELPEEIAMDADNPMYQLIFGMFFNLPTGSECVIPLLLCFPPYNTTSGETTTEVKKAWKVPSASIVLGEMNTVDKKISFTIKLNGTITKGTYTISTSSGTTTPTFNPDT